MEFHITTTQVALVKKKKQRNNSMFERGWPTEKLRELRLQSAVEFSVVSIAPNRAIRGAALIGWSPPPVGWAKFNTDVSMAGNKGRGGGGNIWHVVLLFKLIWGDTHMNLNLYPDIYDCSRMRRDFWECWANSCPPGKRTRPVAASQNWLKIKHGVGKWKCPFGTHLHNFMMC